MSNLGKIYTGAPALVTQSTVVSRDSVRIPLANAALNDLEILGAPTSRMPSSPLRTRKSVGWLVAGPEFGIEEGKNAWLSKHYTA